MEIVFSEKVWIIRLILFCQSPLYNFIVVAKIIL